MSPIEIEEELREFDRLIQHETDCADGWHLTNPAGARKARKTAQMMRAKRAAAVAFYEVMMEAV